MHDREIGTRVDRQWAVLYHNVLEENGRSDNLGRIVVKVEGGDSCTNKSGSGKRTSKPVAKTASKILRDVSAMLPISTPLVAP